MQHALFYLFLRDVTLPVRVCHVCVVSKCDLVGRDESITHSAAHPSLAHSLVRQRAVTDSIQTDRYDKVRAFELIRMRAVRGSYDRCRVANTNSG